MRNDRVRKTLIVLAVGAGGALICGVGAALDLDGRVATGVVWKDALLGAVSGIAALVLVAVVARFHERSDESPRR